MDYVVLLCIAIFFTDSSLLSSAMDDPRRSQALYSPTQYVSLTGDLDATYNLSSTDLGLGSDPTEFRVEALLVNMVNNSTLTKVKVQLTSMTGKVTFKCGSVISSGIFLIQIELNFMNNDSMEGVTLVSNTIDIRWPSFKFTVPLLLETFTADVSITIESTGIACYPKDFGHPTWLELAYYGRNESILMEPSRQKVQEISEFYRITTRDVTIRCIHFDQAGFYRLHLRTDPEVTNISIASSDVIRVMWSEEYNMVPQLPSVFPCARGVTMFYKYPKCILSRDRIRLYGRKRTLAAPVASPAVFHYLAERRVEKDRNSVTFQCHLFNEINYVEYCFKYVSVAMSGAVTEVHSKCVPTHGRKDTPIDGRWGEWSSWSNCRTTCGSGTRFRHRVCDNPKPSNGGLFCIGEAMVADKCILPKCPERLTTQSPIDTYPMKDQCRCGCNFNISSGAKYIASSYRHCTSSATWIITAPETAILHFTFLHFNLNDSTECLQVRDGNLPSSELLLHETGNVIPHPVTTTYNIALLRYHPTPSSSQNQNKNGLGEGFIVRVEIWHHNFSIVPMTRDALQDYRLLSSPFHLAAILFCAVLMSFSLAMAVHHFVQNKKRQGPVASPFESPFGSTPGSLHEGYQQFQPVTSTTSVSDISLRAHHVHTRRQFKNKRRGVSQSIDSFVSLNSSHVSHARSPEDYLRDSKIFESSQSSSVDNSPTRDETNRANTSVMYPITIHKPPLGSSSSGIPKHTRHPPTVPLKQSPLTPNMPRKLPIATVSPQPARTLVQQQEDSIAEQKLAHSKTLYEKKPEKLNEKKVFQKGRRSSAASSIEGESKPASNTSSMKKEPSEPSIPTMPQSRPESLRSPIPRGGVQMRRQPGRNRGDHPRMMASLSEFSLSGTDADFEYDYYDYGMHDNPGSYFSQYPEDLSWLPPFLPVQPPFDESGFPLHDFGRLPEALEGNLMPPEVRLQESSADSINLSADGGTIVTSPSSTSVRTPSKDSPGHGGTKFSSPMNSNKNDFTG